MRHSWRLVALSAIAAGAALGAGACVDDPLGGDEQCTCTAICQDADGASVDGGYTLALSSEERCDVWARDRCVDDGTGISFKRYDWACHLDSRLATAAPVGPDAAVGGRVQRSRGRAAYPAWSLALPSAAEGRGARAL